MFENVSNSITDTTPQIQGAQRTQSRINTQNTPKNTIFLKWKIKGKNQRQREILKKVRGENKATLLTEEKDEKYSEFPGRKHSSIKSNMKSLKYRKEKSKKQNKKTPCQPRIPYPVK